MCTMSSRLWLVFLIWCLVEPPWSLGLIEVLFYAALRRNWPLIEDGPILQLLR
jgi:hypothetical protein